MLEPDRMHRSERAAALHRKRLYAKRRRRVAGFWLLVFSGMGVLIFGGFLLGRCSVAVDFAKSGNANADVSQDIGAVPQKKINKTEWNLILVNAKCPLPADYTVPQLAFLQNGHAVDKRIYPALQEMLDAARAEGLKPLVCSSFRTWEDQEKLYDEKVRKYVNEGFSQAEAESKAAYWVARPGTSEHQTGLAVDIVDMGYQLLDEKQEHTPVQRWMIEHCAEYGFILRYPPDKSGMTDVGYEPWHYRYVGKDAAKKITEKGMCLEEYVHDFY